MLRGLSFPHDWALDCVRACLPSVLARRPMAVFVRSLPGLDPAVLQQVVSLGGEVWSCHWFRLRV